MQFHAHQLAAQEVWIGAGLFVLVLGAVYRGWRRELGVRTVFAFAGALGGAGILGARLLWVWIGPEGPVRSPTRWSALYSAEGSGFASFGGLMAAGLVAVAVRDWMTERRWRRHLDAVVPAGFLGLAVARVGCLPAGCDFGRPTGAGWGLRYPPETPAYATHLAEGWIEPTAAWSLPTHPFPLYLLVVTVVAVLAGSRFESDGAEAGAVAVMYCAGRLGAEAFRGPQTDLTWFGGLVGANQLWAALSLVLLGYVVWRRRDS